jgi:cell division protein FtsB
MMTRKRFRTVAMVLAFYGFAGAAASYFMHHAYHGDRGLHAKASYKIKIAELDKEIGKLRSEKAEWERRVALMRAASLDRDLLDERARTLLNVVHKNDVVVIFPKTP